MPFRHAIYCCEHDDLICLSTLAKFRNRFTYIAVLIFICACCTHRVTFLRLELNPARLDKGQTVPIGKGCDKSRGEKLLPLTCDGINMWFTVEQSIGCALSWPSKFRMHRCKPRNSPIRYVPRLMLCKTGWDLGLCEECLTIKSALSGPRGNDSAL